MIDFATFLTPIGLVAWRATDPARLARFAMHFHFVSKPTRFSKINVLLVARRTVDHVLPLLLSLDILVSRGPRREILKAIGFRTTAPFGVGIRGLHSLLIIPLQAIPMIFRRFSIHVRKLLWHRPSRMQGRF
jgi:hypothetical protein